MVWVLRMFNLDYIRAQQAQLIGREGAGQNMGRVDNTNTFEGTSHRGFLSMLLWCFKQYAIALERSDFRLGHASRGQ